MSQTLTILSAILFTVMGLYTYSVNSQNTTTHTTPYYQTIPQCKALTEPQCIQRLQQQIADSKAKMAQLWEQQQ